MKLITKSASTKIGRRESRGALNPRIASFAEVLLDMRTKSVLNELVSWSNTGGQWSNTDGQWSNTDGQWSNTDGQWSKRFVPPSLIQNDDCPSTSRWFRAMASRSYSPLVVPKEKVLPGPGLASVFFIYILLTRRDTLWEGARGLATSALAVIEYFY
ncbi:hypothetical protein EVAR_52788_1 [Eumeta japonica]|uniref:Uncharacterized protein n=1 Tax=Eumeta variegata TaxID=151549 RepID=A0A4C1Z7G5_EUMVA|nr:hypothetical protein EVAR_52788_1 [Eumeta japonica]